MTLQSYVLFGLAKCYIPPQDQQWFDSVGGFYYLLTNQQKTEADMYTVYATLRNIAEILGISKQVTIVLESNSYAAKGLWLYDTEGKNHGGLVRSNSGEIVFSFWNRSSGLPKVPVEVIMEISSLLKNIEEEFFTKLHNADYFMSRTPSEITVDTKKEILDIIDWLKNEGLDQLEAFKSLTLLA